MYSLVLKNATVIDGTGKPSYVADIGIKDDKIACIGKIEQTENCIDVSGKVVTPGFIDPHSHADRRFPLSLGRTLDDRYHWRSAPLRITRLPVCSRSQVA